jgi:hypothetical protein
MNLENLVRAVAHFRIELSTNQDICIIQNRNSKIENFKINL